MAAHHLSSTEVHQYTEFPRPVRCQSFAEVFPHFDSKVLSAAAKTGVESVDLGRSYPVLGDRRLRLANSSPDVKALFNSPAYIYNFEEHEVNCYAHIGQPYPALPQIFHGSVSSLSLRISCTSLLSCMSFCPKEMQNGTEKILSKKFPSRQNRQKCI
ncbi:hypothetical protein EDD18DRAFT_587675 [Armillaria luteobubalina]|uniref:Uncharacterized protein n=1 Tax=Armillaria luteobubalina TaxID=153913 RepID=A0AA39THT4_9AGAR|nr:hypothetical protein EDD18DRAFT_587675 [Armillaria luteobubalina]